MISSACSPVSGCETSSSSMLTPICLRVRRVHRVLGVDEGADAAAALGLGDHVVDEGRLARRLGAEDLDDAPARQAADAEREVERERAGRDRTRPRPAPGRSSSSRRPCRSSARSARGRRPVLARDPTCINLLNRCVRASLVREPRTPPRSGRSRKCKQPRRTDTTSPSSGSGGSRRGRSRNRSTVTCGSHGRVSRR